MSQTRPEQSNLPNSTSRLLNVLKSLKGEGKNLEPDLPYHESISLPGLWWSRDAYDDTFFAREMHLLTQLALKSPHKKARISIGGVNGILVLLPQELKEIFEEHNDCLDSQESVALFRRHFIHPVMGYTTDDPMWELTRGEVRALVMQLKNNPHKIIEIARKFVAKIRENKKSEINLVELTHTFAASVILSGLDVDIGKVENKKIQELVHIIADGIAKAVRLNSIAKITAHEKFSLYNPSIPSDKIIKEGEKMLDEIVSQNKEDIWKEGNDNSHVDLVRKYFESVPGGFRVQVVRENEGSWSKDPFFVVMGTKLKKSNENHS